MTSLKLKIMTIAAIFCTETALASGIPVVDAAAIAQVVLQLEQLKKEYDMITNHYNQSVSIYSNFTGSRGLGMIHYDPSLRSLIPANVRVGIRQAMRLGKSALSGEALKIFEEGGFGEICDGLTGSGQELCLKEQSGKAQYQAYLQESQKLAQSRLENIESLMQQINTAEDAKAISDLSARIQAEQTALEATKLHASLQLQELERMQAQIMAMEREKRHQKVFRKLSDAELRAALGG